MLFYFLINFGYIFTNNIFIVYLDLFFNILIFYLLYLCNVVVTRPYSLGTT